MFRDSAIAAIRTGVAVAVGFIVTFLLSKGFELPDDLKSNLNVVILTIVTAGYNLAVNLLERHVNPYFGVLLGIPKAPSYNTETPS